MNPYVTHLRNRCLFPLSVSPLTHAYPSFFRQSQVFVLLESLYRAFDKIAKRRRIYKVETIGDCYVAVAGLPDLRTDHAVAMCRFATDCMRKMHELTNTNKLREILGPDIANLSMRVGLHSGAVTAGVLRGERSRFQLFGDAMNTAARMEHNGQPGKIHLSADTASLLIAVGKGKWITPRESKIVAKGKGEMQTFWLSIGAGSVSTSHLSSSFDEPSVVEVQAPDKSVVSIGIQEQQQHAHAFPEEYPSDDAETQINEIQDQQPQNIFSPPRDSESTYLEI